MSVPFSEKEIFCLVARAWADFQERFIEVYFVAEYIGCIKMNRPVLTEAVKHAVIDLRRMADWHLPGPDRPPDRHKYAGFVAKWVAKLRPIYCDKRTRLVHPDPANWINAYFAMWIFRSFLYHPLPPEMSRNLLYGFHFRDERGETLALIAYACEEISRQRQAAP